MKTKTKIRSRILSMALAALMVITLLPVTALATSSATVIDLDETWFGTADFATYSANWEYDVDSNTFTVLDNVNVTGTVTGATAQLTLNVASGKTVTWEADYSGSHSDYLIKPAGSGATFTVENSSIVNSGTAGCIVVNAGSGPIIRVNTGGTVSGSGYAIYSANNVSVNGGTVSSISGTTTSAAICAAAGTVTVTSGSTVSATAGRGIYSSGATVSITGGTVSATTGSAIYASPIGDYASAISVSGGTVSATDGLAINTADSATSTVAVNSGFVFAYGPDLSYVIAMNGSSTPTIGGSGVVTAWNQAAGVTAYVEGAAGDLVSSPTSTATWHKDGAASGIKYGASGFYALAGVSVATAIPTITITSCSVTGANLQANYTLSEAANVWRMYKLASEPAPTAAEIKAFPGGSTPGTAGPNARAQGMLDGPAFQLNTQYTWYMVAENAAGTSAVVSANFTTHPGYALTIQAGTGGTITTGTSGNYPYGYGLGGPGTTIDIEAAANANYTFSGWTTSNGGSFADANSASTTFTMPQNATTVTANFTALSSDASLLSVAGQTITTTGGAGAYNNPYTAAITVPNSKAAIVTADLVVALGAYGALCSNTTSWSVMPSITINVGDNHVYVQVEAEDGVEYRYYDITITRQASAPTGGGGGGTMSYTVKFNSDGGSAISSQSVSHGGKVTKPTDPKKEGFDFAGWYTNSTLTTPYDFSKTVTSGFTLYAKWTEKSSNPFKDVASSAWCYDAVMYVYEEGLMVGTADDMFSPDATLTRAMIVTILYRHAGEPSVAGLSNPFDDVLEGQWYTDAIKWAYANGIVAGYGNGKFGPSDLVTNEQLAALIHRTQISDGKIPPNTGGKAISDADKVSDWAKGVVSDLNKQGIFDDIPGTDFGPQTPATRAEIASMLYKWLAAIY